MEEALLLHARHRIVAFAFTLSATAVLAQPALANPPTRVSAGVVEAAHPAGDIVRRLTTDDVIPFSLRTNPQPQTVPSAPFRTGGFFTSPFSNPAFGFGFGPNGLPICSTSALAPVFFDGIPSDAYAPSCSSPFNRFISQPSNPLAPGENPNALYGRSFSPTNLLQ